MFSTGDTFKQNGDNGTVITYTIGEVTETRVYFTRHYMPQDIQTAGYKDLEWMEEMVSSGEFYDKLP